ncbi:MAG: hypothetical protein WDZ69_02100 [Candidatus Pacearchaeota archaeon]
MIKSKYPGGFDIFGNIALVKFPSDSSLKSKNKKEFAERLLKRHKSLTTVLEKTQKFKGRLRKQETKWLAGEKTKEVIYRENGCVFRFDIDKTYFSPRLSNERKEIADSVKKWDEVLVMFAGVGPYPIVIAKNSKAGRVYSNEINREAKKYAELNVELNKVKEKIVLLPGDVKRVARKLEDEGKKFDMIVMPRPQLKDSFLEQAFALSKGGKKGTRIFYYDFCKGEEIDSVVEKVNLEAKKANKKIKILNVKKAGEIAPYRFRVRVDFRVL